VAHRSTLSVLVVEDDQAMRSLLCEELSELGYRIIEARDGDEALRQIAKCYPALILTDLRMPAGGLTYVHRLLSLVPRCPIILMTAFGEATTRTEAMQWGVAAYFDKPVRMAEVKGAVQRCLQGNGTTSPLDPTDA
jgi:CheY-like chemotaxis protein